MVDVQRLNMFVERVWAEDILPSLVEYIRIPNKSPAFDPSWAEHGFMDEAVELMATWASRAIEPIPNATLEVFRLPGRTPLIFIEIPGSTDDSVLLYGHLDKQPEMNGWEEGLGPWRPVERDDKLYGRGAADDGYAMYASLTSILALHEQGLPHARCFILIEASEESSSCDLPAYFELLAPRLSNLSLVVCLDSGCASYDQLWLTTSLRGQISGVLSVDIIEEGVHSGDASGVVPSSFRVLRHLLSRLEDEGSGEIRLAALTCDIPQDRLEQASFAAACLGNALWEKFPFVAGASPAAKEPMELVLNRTWRPQLAVTGMDDVPPIADAGNVLRPRTSAKLALRLPPVVSAEAAARTVQRRLTEDPPYGATVEFALVSTTSGWNAPSLEPWLAESVHHASLQAFGRPPAFMGEGGSIPFMAMLGEKFPRAQFVVTGVLGPHSNAHGPNEFLHLPTARRITLSIALVLADHASRDAGSRNADASQGKA